MARLKAWCAVVLGLLIPIGVIVFILLLDFRPSPPCTEDTSIEIGVHDSTLHSNGSLLDTRSGILYEPSLYWQTEIPGVYRACICQLRTCIRKCCGEGEVLVIGHGCAPSNSSLVHPFTAELHDDVNSQNSTNVEVRHNSEFALLTGFPSCADERSKFIVDPSESERDRYVLLNNGVLRMIDYPVAIQDQDVSEHCLEAIFKDENDTWEPRILPIMCFPEEPPEPPLPYKIGQIVSIPFLLVTFLVYACIEELRNYHGKSLMCYVTSLLVAFVTLTCAQFKLFVAPSTACTLAASILQFSFLAAFFWLNAMCFDIWWTFSGCKAFKSAIRNGSQERTKFVLCSLYAWGCPFLICWATVLYKFYDSFLPDWLEPNIGHTKCWFDNRPAEMLYFYGPIGLLLTQNVLMFAMTTFKICSSARDTAVLRHRDSNRHNENDRQRFYLYLKLFVLMGANWIMEVVSWFVEGDNPYVWYITDMCDVLTGVIIFALFVCTRKVLRLVRKKLCLELEIFNNSSTKNTSSSKITLSSSAKERGDSNLNGSAISLKTLKHTNSVKMNGDVACIESEPEMNECVEKVKLEGSLPSIRHIDSDVTVNECEINSDPKVKGSSQSIGNIDSGLTVKECVQMSDPKINGSLQNIRHIDSHVTVNGYMSVQINSEPEMNSSSLSIGHIDGDSKMSESSQNFSELTMSADINSDLDTNGSSQNIRYIDSDSKTSESLQNVSEINSYLDTSGPSLNIRYIDSDSKTSESLQNISEITMSADINSDLDTNGSSQNIGYINIHSIPSESLENFSEITMSAAMNSDLDANGSSQNIRYIDSESKTSESLPNVSEITMSAEINSDLDRNGSSQNIRYIDSDSKTSESLQNVSEIYLDSTNGSSQNIRYIDSESKPSESLQNVSEIYLETNGSSQNITYIDSESKPSESLRNISEIYLETSESSQNIRYIDSESKPSESLRNVSEIYLETSGSSQNIRTIDTDPKTCESLQHVKKIDSDAEKNRSSQSIRHIAGDSMVNEPETNGSSQSSTNIDSHLNSDPKMNGTLQNIMNTQIHSDPKPEESLSEHEQISDDLNQTGSLHSIKKKSTAIHNE